METSSSLFSSRELGKSGKEKVGVGWGGLGVVWLGTARERAEIKRILLVVDVLDFQSRNPGRVGSYFLSSSVF